MASALDELISLEAELDAKVPALPLTRIPVRSVLAMAHGTLDVLVHGDRLTGAAPVSGKADAFAGRLFGLGAVLKACPPRLGGTLADAFAAYAAADPDGSQLALLAGYGHLSEVMPEVHRERWVVSGDRRTGFRLDHPPGYATFEARDFLLLQLVTPTAPAPFALPPQDIATIAASCTDLAAVDRLAAPLVAQMRTYYERALVEERLLSDNGFRAATGRSRTDWLALRGALWAWATLANAVTAELWAEVRAGDPARESLAWNWTSVCCSWGAFIAAASRSAELTDDAVEGLLAPFVLDLRPGQQCGVIADGFIPPLVRLEESVITSPDMVRAFLLERNILYVLNATKRGLFDSVVSDHLEPELLKDAAALLRSIPGWTVAENVTWASGEIDLLAYSAEENVAVHVQAKAGLAPHGARMLQAVEGRAEEGLAQLRRLSQVDATDRDRIFTAALGKPVSGAQVVDVLLSRSCFGTARVWREAGPVALVNLGLLRLWVQHSKDEGTFPPRLRTLAASVASLLDEFEGEAGVAWVPRASPLGDTSIEVPMLDFDESVVARYGRRAQGA